MIPILTHMVSSSVVSYLWPHGFLYLWNFLGKNTGVGCHFLLHGAWKILHALSSTSSFGIYSENSNMPRVSFYLSSDSWLSGIPNLWHVLYLKQQIICTYSHAVVAQWVKNPPALQEMQETRVQYLDREDSRMAAHSSILAWKIHGQGTPRGLPFMGLQRVRHDTFTLFMQLEPISVFMCFKLGWL